MQQVGENIKLAKKRKKLTTIQYDTILYLTETIIKENV